MPSHIAPLADAILGAALAHGERLAGEATAFGLAFTLEELGDIDIPDTAATRIDRAQLRALATLYLAADLEPAGVIPSIETLTGLVSTGALKLDLGGAAPLVEKWWADRNSRINAAERNAFFSRLFGTSNGPTAADADRNFHFEDRMLELCEALVRLDEAASAQVGGLTSKQALVRNSARNLAQNLAGASGGITAYLATEIISMLKQAFAILGHNDLRGCFGARDLWGVVSGIMRNARVRSRGASPYVRRGKAGMTLLSWLAENVDKLSSGGQLAIAPGDPVIGAATDWVEATLEIGEASASTVSPPPASDTSRGAAPSWAALGG